VFAVNGVIEFIDVGQRQVGSPEQRQMRRGGFVVPVCNNARGRGHRPERWNAHLFRYVAEICDNREVQPQKLRCCGSATVDELPAAIKCLGATRFALICEATVKQNYGGIVRGLNSYAAYAFT